jgi:roadblock/LC7 domain-containing protein
MIAIVYNELCTAVKVVVSSFSKCISEVGDTMKWDLCENAAMSCGNMMAMVYDKLCTAVKVAVSNFDKVWPNNVFK